MLFKIFMKKSVKRIMYTFIIKNEISKFSNILIGYKNSNVQEKFFSGINSLGMAYKEVEIILSYVLQKNKVFFKIYDSIQIEDEQYAKICDFIERRAKGEPLAYILGIKEFFGYDFYVNQSTLIPRPDTELLIETALDYFHNKKDTIYLSDFGTGTGCILLTLLKEWKNAFGIGVDISKQALELAQKNAISLEVEHNAFFLYDDFTSNVFLENFLVFIKNCFKQNSLDLLISNPPYIPQNEYIALDNSVKEFEPKTALYSPDSKAMGTFHIEKVIQIAEKILKPKGLLLIEHGYNQGKDVCNICLSYGFDQVQTKFDYAGNERFLYAIKQ